jgi:hypothetical protein
VAGFNRLNPPLFGLLVTNHNIKVSEKGDSIRQKRFFSCFKKIPLRDPQQWLAGICGKICDSFVKLLYHSRSAPLAGPEGTVVCRTREGRQPSLHTGQLKLANGLSGRCRILSVTMRWAKTLRGRNLLPQCAGNRTGDCIFGGVEVPGYVPRGRHSVGPRLCDLTLFGLADLGSKLL